MRPLAKALKVRFRAEVALGRFDDALKTAKTMFAMSRHLALHPIYVSDLVGIAIAVGAIGPLEEMLEQPGCPNLYWALTNLPIPLVPIDKGSEGERVGIMSEFHDLDDSAPMSAEQIKKFIAHMDRILIDTEQTQYTRVGSTRGPRTKRWSSPHAAVSSSTASPRSGCCGSRPTR